MVSGNDFFSFENKYWLELYKTEKVGLPALCLIIWTFQYKNLKASILGCVSFSTTKPQGKCLQRLSRLLFGFQIICQDDSFMLDGKFSSEKASLPIFMKLKQTIGFRCQSPTEWFEISYVCWKKTRWQTLKSEHFSFNYFKGVKKLLRICCFSHQKCPKGYIHYPGATEARVN